MPKKTSRSVARNSYASPSFVSPPDALFDLLDCCLALPTAYLELLAQHPADPLLSFRQAIATVTHQTASLWLVHETPRFDGPALCHSLLFEGHTLGVLVVQVAPSGQACLPTEGTRWLINECTTWLALIHRLSPSPPPAQAATSCSLTPREQQVLIALDDEPTLEAVARRLQIAPGTVRTHAGKIRQKLGVANIRHALALAHELHLITPAFRPDKNK